MLNTQEPTVDNLTAEDRTEWIAEADEALRGLMKLRRYSPETAYQELRNQRVWRQTPASTMLRKAYEAMRC